MIEMKGNTPAVISQSKNASMTTVEIAEQTGKRHDNVLRDTRAMLVELYGEKDLLTFEEMSKDTYGRERKCYSLPKDEVLCLVAGYSTPLRMKIIKRLDELESGTPILNGTPESAIGDLKATIEMADIFGLKGNQALLSANTAVRNIHGIDCMETLGITGLIAEDQEQFFTPTILGEKMGLSAVKFNQALETAGMQISNRDHKNKLTWEATEKGKEHCQIVDTGKKHKGGSPVTQIKWSESVVNCLI